MDVVSKSKSDKQSFNSSVRSFYKSLFAIGAVVCIGAVYWQMQDSNVAQQQPLPTDILVEKIPPFLDSTTPLYLVDKQALSIVEREGQQLSFTFEQQVNVNDERGSLNARVHQNTRISRYSGGAIDYRQLTLHQSDASQFQIEGDVHSFEFGIKDQHLIFSKPIELSINVDYPDGTPVSIYAKHAGQELGQSGLTQDFSASCSNGVSSNESNQAVVQNGKVSFATCGASLFVVRDNVDNIEIDTVRGMCLNNRSFQYQVHWHDDSGTVTQVQVIDDNNMVLASGSSSPVIVNKSGSSNRTAFNIRIRDLNNTSDISPRYVVRPEDCRGFDLKTYTSDSQFTVPNNVYAIEILAIGGGGGGQAVIDGNGNNGPTLAGGGGGGGASASSVISVLPGEVYKVFVGAGGKNNVGESKKNGEDSYFTLTNANSALVLAAGGKTPSSAETTSQTTGAAGGQASDSVGQIRFNGGDGGNGNDNSNNLKAGAGGGAGGYAGHGSDGANGFDPGRGGVANTAFFPDGAGDGGNGKVSSSNSQAKDGFDGNIYGGAGSGGIFGKNTNGKKADGGRGAKGAIWIRPVDSLTNVTLTQTSNQQDPVLDKTTVKFSLKFGHPIDESTLTCGDFTIAGAAGAVCDSITEGTPHDDTKYFIELTTANNGPLTIAMNSNSVKDSSNNFMPTPFGGDTNMLMLGHADTTKPNVSIEQASSQADPDTSDGTIVYRATFDEPIKPETFTCADIVLSGSAIASCSGITEQSPNNGRVFDVQVIASTNGIVTATIMSDSVSDYKDNTNNASTSSDNSVRVSTLALNRAPILNDKTLSLPENSAVGNTLWTMTQGDPDEEVLIYSIATGDPNGQFEVNSSGVISVKANNALDFEAASNSFNLTVRAEDVHGASDTASVVINLTNVNEAPAITGTPAGSINEEALYSFTPTANDVDAGDTKTFSLINAPSWLTVNPNTGQISGTPSNDDVGIYTNISIRITDGSGLFSDLTSFAITVNNTNDAPTISGAPAITINEDASYSFTPTANDIDVGDNLTFTITNKPVWATFDAATGKLSGTPTNDDVGTTNNIVISVRDSEDETASLAAFNLTVNNVNDKPTISGSPITSVNEDSAYSFTPSANDVDTGDTLTFSISATPSWTTFDTATGELSGTPTNDDVGTTSNIVISVKDSEDETAFLAAFNLTVNNVNDAPTISGSPITSVNEDSAYSFTPSANDVDTGDTLTFSISTTPSWATFDTATGMFSGTPTNDDVGTTSNIVISVKDVANATASLAAFDLTVVNLNQAPALSGGSFSIAENSVLNTNVGTALSLVDPDIGDSHTFSITNGNRDNAFKITNDGQLQVLTPSALNFEERQSFALTVEVSDGALTDTASVTVTVNDVQEISNFSIADIESTSVFENTVYQSPVAAISGTPIGNVTYSKSGDDATLFTLDTATGELGLGAKDFEAPADNDTNNTYLVTLTATDDDQNTAEKDIVITVTNFNVAPVIDKTNLTDQTQAEDFTDYTLGFTVTDADQDDITLSINNSAPTIVDVSVSPTTAIDYAAYNVGNYDIAINSINNQFGSAAIELVATDMYGVTDVASFNMTIPAVLDFPTLASLDISLNEDFSDFDVSLENLDFAGQSSLTIDVSFSDSTVVQPVSQVILNSVDGTTGKFTLQSITDAFGSTTATITVTANGQTPVSKDITITVNPVNDAPTISGSAAVATELQAYAWTPTFDDIDNAKNALTFSQTGLPAWVTLNAATGEISGTPTVNDQGSSNAVIAVSDGALSANLSITINVNNVNQAPVYTDTDFTVVENSANNTLVGTHIASDIDAGDVHTYSIESGNTGNAFAIDNDGKITVNDVTALDYETNAEFTLEIKAQDNGGLSDLALVTVGLTNVNEAPTIGGAAPTTIAQNAFYQFTALGNDVDAGDTLTYSAANLPTWLTIDSATGILSGTPTNSDLGDHSNITITVKDALNLSAQLAPFTVMVTDVNDLPIVTGTPALFVDEDSAYSFKLTISDLDVGDTHVISGTNIPSWLTINQATQTLEGTPRNGDVGVYSDITLTVTDSSNGSNSLAPFELTVKNTNDVPVISGVAATTVNQGVAYSFTPGVVDVDLGDSVSFSITGKPSWLTFDTATGKLSGTPSNSDVGNYSNIIITATDSNDAQASLSAFAIAVVNVNDAPTISGVPASSVNEDSLYSFTPSILDIDSGDNHSFSATGLPSWLTLNTSTGVISGTPSNSDVGSYANIVLTVQDAAGARASLPAFSVTVNNVNDAPTITGTPTTTIAQGSAYRFTAQGDDIDDGDTLTYSITNKPNWAVFNATNGVLQGTPSNGDVGTTANIVISVQDAANQKVSLAAFSIEVTNVNDAPTISGVPVGGVLQGEAYSFIPSANDIDVNDELTFSATNLPSWLSLDTSSGQISGVPANADVGVFANIVISVKDKANATASLPAFTITVSNSNDAPVISGVPNTSVNQDTVYSFTPSASDQDVGDELSFSIVNKPSWASFDSATGALAGTPTNSDVGTTNGIVISVLDKASAKASLASFAIEVVNVNDAPVISGAPATSVLEDAPYSFTPVASDIDNNDSLSFSITNKPSWANFNAQTGQLSGTPDNSHVGTTSNIVITVTDNAGANAALTAFNVEVINVNQPPSLANQNFAIAENSAADTLVGTPLSASDPDAATTLSYTITNGNGDDAFAIDNNGQLTVKTPSALNFENKTQYSLTIEVSDSELGDTAVVTIDVTDVVEAATFSINDIGATKVSENVVYQSPVIQTTGEHIGELSYALIGDDAALFSVDSTTGEFTLPAQDFELPADANTDNNYQMTLTAVDSDGNSATKDFVIVVTNYNVAPTITSDELVKQTQQEDFSDYQLGFMVTDNDKDKLTLSLNNSTPSVVTVSVAPTTELSFADYDNAAYNLSVASILDQFGAANIQLIATDMYGESTVKSFDIVIPAVLDFPNLSTELISLNEDYAPYTVTLENIDFAGEPSVTVEVSVDNADLLEPVTPLVVSSSRASAQLTLRSKANKHGTGNITFTVKADGNPDVTKTIPMTVMAVNDAPVISGTPIVAVEAQAYGWLPTASDIENDTLSFSASNLPPWASINANTGEITGTPTIFDANVHDDVVISVNDGELSSAMTVTIEVQNTNQDPVYDDGFMSIAENSAVGSVVGTHTAQDVDRHALTYAIDSGNTGNAFDINANGEVVVAQIEALDYESNSRFELIVRATDAEGASDTATLVIDLIDVNEAPAIEVGAGAEPSATIDQGDVYNFTPSGSDIDGGDVLTYSIANQPSWLSFDVATGQLSGISDNGAVGEYNDIVISVSDTAGLSQDLAPFTIVVNNLNDAPVISGTPVTEIDEGQTYTFAPTASDIDVGDTLTFAIENLPSWMTFDSLTGVLTGTPENGQVGSYNNIEISVTDSEGLSDSLASFSIDVINVNNPPTLDDAEFSIAEDTAIGSAVGSPLFASDIDVNTEFSYSITSGNLNNTFAIDDAGQLSLLAAVDFESLTTYTLSVEVSDGALSATNTVVIEVTDVLDGIDKDIDDVNKAITGGTTSTIEVDKYTAIGVTGVNGGNVEEVNKRVGGISPEKLPVTPSTIQVIVDEINALKLINEYSTSGGNSTKPTVEDFEKLGIKGITNEVLDALNKALAANPATRTIEQLKVLISDLTKGDSDNDGLPDELEERIGSSSTDNNSPTLNGNGDNDGDGVTNAVEAYLASIGGQSVPNTSPSTDSDGDGLPDALEVARGSDPLGANDPTDNGAQVASNGLTNAVNAYLKSLGLVNGKGEVEKFADYDNDGINDALEVTLGGNPLRADDNDVDDDGVVDFIESFLTDTINDGQDTKELDLNANGLSDAYEVRQAATLKELQDLLAIKQISDSDGDGISDAVEEFLTGGDNSESITPESDSDGDGITDIEEIESGSNPLRNDIPVLWVESTEIGDDQLGLETYFGGLTATKVTYNWTLDSLTDAGMTVSGTDIKQPVVSQLVAGLYPVSVTVVRTINGQALSSTAHYVVNISDSGELAVKDSDGDGVADNVDTDNGNSDKEETIPTKIVSEDTFKMMTQNGIKLRLGVVAILAGNNGSEVSEESIAQFGDGQGGKVDESLALDNDFDHLDAFDYEALNLPEAGAMIPIFIPLTQAIPENASLRKFNPTDGWKDYNVSGEDSFATAPAVTDGVCSTDIDDYTSGLTQGHMCLLLQITDGGANDSDGLINGMIVDPVAISAPKKVDPVTPPPPPKPEPTPEPEYKTGTKGGSVSLFIFVLLGMLFMLRQIQFNRGYAALSRRVRQLPLLAVVGMVGTLALVGYSPTTLADNTKKERSSHGFVHLGAGASSLTPLKDDVKLDTENNVAWQFGAGWQFNQYFAIEGYYANLDKYEISNSQSIDYRSIGLQITGYWPVTENGRLLAFVGGSELDTKGHNVNVTQVESNSVHLGAGFEYDWDANWFSRIQWTTIDEDADMFTVHFGRRFGVEAREKAAKPSPIKPAPKLAPKLAKVKKEVVKPVVEKVASTRFIEYVGFDHDEQGLDTRGREQISRAIKLMKASPSSRAVLFGHTDNVGSSEYNFKLSLSRANNIRDMLTAAGIDKSRIRVKAYGDTAPIASNNYFKGRVKNRRVEVMIIE